MSGTTESGSGKNVDAVAWQTGVWNRMSDVYVREIDERFAPVVEAVIARARLEPGEQVLDLGTGTGAVAERAASLVGAGGRVVGVDLSPEMLARAGRRFSPGSVTLREGRAEAIPAADREFDVVLSSLTLMYVIDRAAAARELARVLRPGGRLVASVWAGPESCDIVRFQQTAGRFAGPPPVPGVGPGALADPAPFLAQLEDAGFTARVEVETTAFTFPDFDAAWDALAGVTTAHLAPDAREAARRAVCEAMFPEATRPRRFENRTQLLLAELRR